MSKIPAPPMILINKLRRHQNALFENLPGCLPGALRFNHEAPTRLEKEHWAPGQAHLYYILCRRPHSPWDEPSDIKGVCLSFRVRGFLVVPPSALITIVSVSLGHVL